MPEAPTDTTLQPLNVLPLLPRVFPKTHPALYGAPESLCVRSLPSQALRFSGRNKQQTSEQGRRVRMREGDCCGRRGNPERRRVRAAPQAWQHCPGQGWRPRPLPCTPKGSWVRPLPVASSRHPSFQLQVSWLLHEVSSPPSGHTYDVLAATVLHGSLKPSSLSPIINSWNVLELRCNTPAPQRRGRL